VNTFEKSSSMKLVYDKKMIRHLDSMDSATLALAKRIMENPYDANISCAYLSLIPTLSEQHFSDLKLEWVSLEVPSTAYRFYVSRMTRQDGAKCDHEVILERRITAGPVREHRWRMFSHGPAKMTKES